MTRRSKLWKSPRPVYSVAFAERRACERACARAGHGRSDLVAPAGVKSDRVPVRPVATGRVLRGVNPNHDESAKRAVLVAKARAPSRPPHDLQKVH
jgi:hypothetical protein